MESEKKVVVDLTGADSLDEIFNGAVQAIGSGIPIRQLIGVCDDEVARIARKHPVLKGLTFFIAKRPPTNSINDRKDTPIWQGISFLKPAEGQPAHAFVSAGNTGIVVRSAIDLLLGKLTAFRFRPAIAVVMPHAQNCILADIGAILQLKPSTYLHLANMCQVYAQKVFGIKNPGIRILNVGIEEGKGTSVVQDASKLLERHEELNYLGYSEGGEIAQPNADTNVILCDGFVGNVILKMWEKMTGRGQEIGGCPLLGINGNIIIAHGGSTAEGYCNAIRAAFNLADTDLDLAIQRKLGRIS